MPDQAKLTSCGCSWLTAADSASLPALKRCLIGLNGLTNTHLSPQKDGHWFKNYQVSQVSLSTLKPVLNHYVLTEPRKKLRLQKMHLSVGLKPNVFWFAGQIRQTGLFGHKYKKSGGIKGEALGPKTTLPTVRHGGGSIMLWN